MTKKIDKKVLIVEDDEDLLFIFKTKFENSGFSVIASKDGQEGIDAAERENPDVILSDILMPGMNGIEMAKKIRESDKKVLIIFLTNLKDVAYIKEIEESGDFEYLIKSDIRIGEIVDKVKTKLGL